MCVQYVCTSKYILVYLVLRLLFIRFSVLNLRFACCTETSLFWCGFPNMRSCAVAVTPERVPSNPTLCSVEWLEPAHHGNHNQKVHPTCFSWKISFYKRSKFLSPTVSNSCPQLYQIPVPNSIKFLSPTVSNSCPKLYQIPVPNCIKGKLDVLPNCFRSGLFINPNCFQIKHLHSPNCV